MFHCMFASPLACLQHIVSETVPPLPADQDLTGSIAAAIPFQVDPDYQVSVDCVTEEDGCLVASFDCAVPGYFIGQTPLTSGKYIWKVCWCVH